MEEDRATPICMLPGQNEVTEEVKEEKKEMIKMEIKKKDSDDKKSENESEKGKLTIDSEMIILFIALFVAGFLSRTQLQFLPEPLRSSDFVFACTKAVIILAGMYFYRKYF